jgi:hypothetical protein
MAFYVGQKVVCVDATKIHTPLAPRMVQRGGIYIVSALLGDNLLIEGHPNPGMGAADIGWRAYRFRPVVERKTDISIFKAMLNPKTAEIDA